MGNCRCGALLAVPFFAMSFVPMMPRRLASSATANPIVKSGNCTPIQADNQGKRYAKLRAATACPEVNRFASLLSGRETAEIELPPPACSGGQLLFFQSLATG